MLTEKGQPWCPGTRLSHKKTAAAVSASQRFTSYKGRELALNQRTPWRAQKTCAFGKAARRRWKTKPKPLGYTPPRGSARHRERRLAQRPGHRSSPSAAQLCQRLSPLAQRPVTKWTCYFQPQAFQTTTTKKNRKRIPIWVEQWVYTNEVELRSCKHSGRLCAVIRTPG